MIKLDNTRGLPMYFIHQRISGLDFKVNFSDDEVHGIGEEFELGMGIYRIDAIHENRLSPLDYGVSHPVYFCSTTSRLVRRVEYKEVQGVRTRQEIPA